MQFLLLRQAGCSHVRCSQSCPSQNPRLVQQSAGGVLSRSIRHVPTKVRLSIMMLLNLMLVPQSMFSKPPRPYCVQAGRPHLAHGRCQAIPDQHAIDLLMSSSSSSPPALMGEQSQALHHSAAAVQVLSLPASVLRLYFQRNTLCHMLLHYFTCILYACIGVKKQCFSSRLIPDPETVKKWCMRQEEQLPRAHVNAHGNRWYGASLAHPVHSVHR